MKAIDEFLEAELILRHPTQEIVGRKKKGQEGKRPGGPKAT